MPRKKPQGQPGPGSDETCGPCEGSGTVPAEGGGTITCPNCHGSGKSSRDPRD